MADPHHLKALKKAGNKPGNEVCADCKCPNPTWISTNIGVFLCIKCAGVHRSLGTHVSKVKSISLDKWNDAAVQFVCSHGNSKANAYFLARCPPSVGISENTTPVEREAFIRDKYINRRFFATPVNSDLKEKGIDESKEIDSRLSTKVNRHTQAESMSITGRDLMLDSGILHKRSISGASQPNIQVGNITFNQCDSSNNQIVSSVAPIRQHRMNGVSPWVPKKKETNAQGTSKDRPESLLDSKNSMNSSEDSRVDLSLGRNSVTDKKLQNGKSIDFSFSDVHPDMINVDNSVTHSAFSFIR